MFDIVKNILQGLKDYRAPVIPNFRPEPKQIVPAEVYANCDRWKGIVLHHCLHGDSMVLTDKGPIKIKDINIGSMVYGLDSNNNVIKNRVANKWSKGLNQVYKIRTATRTILATDEHPLFALIKPGKGGGNQYTPHHRQEMGWRKIKELKKGDHIAIFNGKDDGTEDPSKSDELLQLVGFFIGDGSMRLHGCGYSPNSHGGQVNFHAICAAKKPYAGIAKEEFGDITVDKTGIRVYSKKTAELFNSLGLYKKCKEKILPEWIFGLSRRQKLLILRGILDSDGTVTKRGSINIRLNNKLLVDQIRHLAMQCGIRVSNLYYSSAMVTFNGYTYLSSNWGFQGHNVLNNVEIGSNREDNKRKMIALRVKKTRDYKGCKINPGILKDLKGNGIALDTIYSIEKNVYDNVYDIEIDGCHNFVADGIFVHNSATVDGKFNDWDGIRRYHMSYRIDGESIDEESFKHRQMLGQGKHFEKPWSDIGYNGGWEMDNGVFKFKMGRSWNRAGAHAGLKGNNTFNEQYLGLCLVGNFDKAAPTPEQWAYCVKTVKEICQTIGIDKVNVLGHREVYDLAGVPRQKTCPGTQFNIEAFRRQL